MERELATNLLKVANLFAGERKLSLTTLGRLAAADGRFFENLEDPSKTFTARKYDEVLAYFSAHWPDPGPHWPDGVPRPDKELWAKIQDRALARAAARRTSGTASHPEAVA